MSSTVWTPQIPEAVRARYHFHGHRPHAASSAGELESICRLREGEALELLGNLRAHPAHQLQLARALDCVRCAGPARVGGVCFGAVCQRCTLAAGTAPYRT